MKMKITISNNNKTMGDITLTFKKLRAAKKTYRKLVKRWNSNKVVDIPTHAIALPAGDISCIYLEGE